MTSVSSSGGDSISVKNMNEKGGIIEFNGHTITVKGKANSIIAKNGKLFINGQEVTHNDEGIELISLPEINIVIEGDFVGESLQSSGSVVVKGSVTGNVSSRDSLTCSNVTGNVESRDALNCGAISGNASSRSGMVVNGGVGGNADSRDAMTVHGDVGKNASSRSSMKIDGNVSGDVESRERLQCGSVGGNATSRAGTSVNGFIVGDVESRSEVRANFILGEVQARGNVSGSTLTKEDIQEALEEGRKEREAWQAFKRGGRY